MHEQNWGRVEAWWADLFGCSRSQLWHGISVCEHAGLGDYEGIFVVVRHNGVHVSLPQWVSAADSESLSTQGVSRLADSGFWRTLPATANLRVLGPSVHSYTDHDPGEVRQVDLVDCSEVAELRARVDDEEWQEGGFAETGRQNFVLRHEGIVVAAANLTEFLGSPSDVGVVVHRSYRGRGLGRQVGRAATSYAVRHAGIARWRALTTNVPSRAVAAALGYEDYCHQLAVRAS